jgi:hypothetical protein
MSVKVHITHDETSEVPFNIKLPQSALYDSLLFGNDKKSVLHLEKIYQYYPFSKLKISVEAHPKVYSAAGNNSSSVIKSANGNGKFIY